MSIQTWDTTCWKASPGRLSTFLWPHPKSARNKVIKAREHGLSLVSWVVGIIFILLTHHGPVYLPKRFTPCSCRAAAIPALSSAFPAGGPEAQRPGQDLGCGTAHWVPPVPPPCPGLRRARSRPRIPAHPGHGTARCPRRWDIPARCEPAPALPRKALPAPMVPVPAPRRAAEAAVRSSRRSRAGAAPEPRCTPGSAERANPQHLRAPQGPCPPSRTFRMLSV